MQHNTSWVSDVKCRASYGDLMDLAAVVVAEALTRCIIDGRRHPFLLLLLIILVVI